MHADHDQGVAVLLLQRPQLVEHVKAVDAAERPEVEQHDLAAQVGERQIPTTGVEPAAALELRSAYACSHRTMVPHLGAGPGTKVVSATTVSCWASGRARRSC